MGTCAFGKIPGEGDFIRVGQCPLFAELDEWVSQGISLTHAGGAASFEDEGELAVVAVGFVDDERVEVLLGECCSETSARPRVQ